MKINSETNLSLPIRNLVALIFVICSGLWAYFGIVERLNTLETSKQLMEADLLKKAEQTPKNLEMLMLIELNASIIEKHQEQLDENVHTKVLLMEEQKKIEKLIEDVEKLDYKNNELNDPFYSSFST